jgi:PAS domain S-box-containing protein
MKDARKSKKHLINKSEELRQHIAELETLEAEHERGQEALRESEEKYRALVEQANDGILIVQDGAIKFANRRLAEANGRTVEELLNTNFLDYVHPNEVPVVANRYHRRLAGEDAEQVYETVLLHKEGHEIPVEINAGTITYQGSPAVFAFVRDHTERKQAEEALRESNETLQALISSSPLAIFAIDPESKVTMWNPAAENIFGWTEGEVLGQYLPIVPPDKSAEHHELRTRAFSGNTFTGVEVSRQRKDGTPIDVSLSTAPVYDSGGRIKSIMAVLEDISERKRAEEVLRESEERYSSLFKDNHSVMLLINPENAAIVDANPAACSFYGWSHEELTSRKITDVNTLTREQVCREMKRAQSGKAQHFLFRHRLANGEVRDVEVYSGPIIIDGKQLLYSIIHDISERRLAEEKLQKAHTRLEQRAVELNHLNEKLKQEIEERKLVEQKLRKREAELETKANELEEVNVALRVLLKRRDEDKTEMEKKILYNVKELVLPYVERLRKAELKSQCAAYVNILESNLNDIISPFALKLSSKLLGLTPTEIQVANLIKEGKTTKDIAVMLHLSPRTVEFHRNNIRKKMGIKNKKANLRSHLQSM